MSTGAANRPIGVFVVDDHPVVRVGIVGMVAQQTDMIVVGEASDGAEAIESFARLKPDVTLMDLQMPGLNGVEVISAIRRDHPAARILVLTTYAGDVMAVRALKAGAVGLLLKSSLRRELMDVIRGAHLGRRHVPPQIANEIAVHSADQALSRREIDILGLVAAGEANKQVARQLSLSEDTVKAHLKNIFTKLDVTDRTHAVTVALRRGILEL